jgi:hypothetical protein
MRQLEANEQENENFCGLAQDGSSQDHEPFGVHLSSFPTILAFRDLNVCIS